VVTITSRGEVRFESDAAQTKLPQVTTREKFRLLERPFA